VVTSCSPRTANPPKLVVAGGLDEADYVEGLQPLLTERTVLAGKFTRSAMAPLYRGSKIYINASLHEGSSNAVLEAIGAGCSILLSDIPENRDFGMPLQNYFDPNSPESIAEALKRALSDPHAYVADAGRYLTWTKVAERTLDIYRGIAPFHGSEIERPDALVSAS
jgi:glycosyltransferase involved in cell wall biosynthesis